MTQKFPHTNDVTAEDAVSRNPVASLSLDMDNLWSYLKVHGDPQWRSFPTYLDRFVPIILDFLDRHGLKVTFMMVGQDAVNPLNAEALRLVAQAGHEIGNHSFNHEPWMIENSPEEIYQEILNAHQAIEAVTGIVPRGLRGPGFCYNRQILQAIQRLDYEYDASMLPSVLGPVARLYYLWGTGMATRDRDQRKALFGNLSDGFAPLRPFEWNLSGGRLLEIPVSTIPLLRVPFHLSYLLWLSRFSRPLAFGYLRFAMRLCRLRGIEPSFLLHPLDFLGRDDVEELHFFPAMDLTRTVKLEIAGRCLEIIRSSYEIVPLIEHARLIRYRGQALDAREVPQSLSGGLATSDCR